MKIEIIGGEDEAEYLSISAAHSVNWYPSQGGDNAKYLTNLLPTPGLKPFIALNDSGEIRNLNNDANFAYAVSGKNFYRLNINGLSKTGTAALKGSIVSSTGFVSSAVNETQIMIVDGTTKGFIYTPGTDTFAEITDPDFKGGDTVVYMGGFFFYNQPGTAIIQATALQDGFSIGALDFASAEVESDLLVGVARNNDRLWALGTDTVQIFDKTANPTAFPYTPTKGAFIRQGCSSKGSIKNFDGGLVWLDDRRFVVKDEGPYKVTILSNISVSRQIQNFSVVDDSIGMVYALEGQLFYKLTFPTEGKTFVYNAATQTWHTEVSIIAPNEEVRHLANSVISFKGLNIVGGYREGKIFILDKDTHTDDGNILFRERVSQHMHVQGKTFNIQRLTIDMDAGVGLTSGQGEDPLVIMQYSKDSGKNFSNNLYRSFGKKGDYTKVPAWNGLGKMKVFTLKIRVTDPVPAELSSADVKGYIGD